VLLLTFLQWPLIYQPVHCQQDQLNACTREGWSLMSDPFPEHEQLNNCRITRKMCYFILLYVEMTCLIQVRINVAKLPVGTTTPVI
jgi:hypothetical protein